MNNNFINFAVAICFAILLLISIEIKIISNAENSKDNFKDPDSLNALGSILGALAIFGILAILLFWLF